MLIRSMLVLVILGLEGAPPLAGAWDVPSAKTLCFGSGVHTKGPTMFLPKPFNDKNWNEYKLQFVFYIFYLDGRTFLCECCFLGFR